MRFKKFHLDWNSETLNELFEIKSSGDLKKELLSKVKNENTPYPVYGNSVVDGGLLGYYPTFEQKAGALTVTGRGVNIGVPFYRNAVFNAVGRLLVLTPKNQNSAKFFEYVISKIRIYNETTGVPQLTSPALGNYLVNFPELAEQVKIASFLDLFDRKIQLQQQKIDLLQEQKKGYMQKVFKQEIRFAGFTEEWEQRKLGDVYNFMKGKGLPLDSFNDQEGNPAIAYGHLYTKYSEVIDEVQLFSSDNGVISEAGDILFPGSSTVPFGTAQASAVLKSGIHIGGDVIIARAKNEIPNPAFVSYYINAFRTKLYPLTVGITITHMYGKDIALLNYYFPKNDEQEKIGEFFKKIDEVIVLQEKKIELLQEQKKGFMQQMFI